MKTAYYFKRIINDKVKLCIILLLFLIMVADLLPQLQFLPVGGRAYAPDFSTFLSNNLLTQFLFFVKWFLPLWLMLVVSDDIMEDYTTGYRNILISKFGRKKYMRVTVLRGFVFSFLLIFIALMLNFLLAHIIYKGCSGSIMDEVVSTFNKNHLLVRSMEKPTQTNLIYIFAFSVLSGLIGAGNSALALAIHKRKFTYPLAFFIWFILINISPTILTATQPFVEYDLDYVLRAFIISVSVYIIVIIAAYVKERKYAQI